MGTIQRLSGGNYILAIDGQIRTSCCCATTTGITCANNDPSMVLTITAPDGDLPITWCGKTWVASTETPGTNEAYSGQPQEVCPTNYRNGVYTNTGSVDAVEEWQYNTSLSLIRENRLAITGTKYFSFSGMIRYNKVRLFTSGILGSVRYFCASFVPYSRPVPITFTTTAGNTQLTPLVTGIGCPRLSPTGTYQIQNQMFGSFTTGNVTYSWSKGTNW